MEGSNLQDSNEYQSYYPIIPVRIAEEYDYQDVDDYINGSSEERLRILYENVDEYLAEEEYIRDLRERQEEYQSFIDEMNE